MKKEVLLESIAKGAGIIFFGLIISKVLGYVYRLIIARLGPGNYGLLSLGMAIFGIITLISVFGLDFGVLRYVSYYKAKGKKEKIKEIINSALKINLTLSVILGFLMFISSNWIALNIFHNVKLSFIIKILAIAVPFGVLRSIMTFVMKGLKKIKYEVYSVHIIDNSIKIILTILLLYLGFEIYGAAIAITLAIFISFIITAYFLQKKVFPFLDGFIKTKYFNKELLLYSWPLLFSEILAIIMSWADTLLLGYFKTSADVGVYNAAMPTVKLAAVIPYAFTAVFLPIISKLYVDDEFRELKNIFQMTIKWIFKINIILIVIFILFSKQILKILFGIQYVDGWMPLIILGFGYFLFYLAICSKEILMLIKKTKLIFFITSIGAIFNIVLNIILIPRFGIIGAAIATTVSLSLIALFILIYSYKFIRIKPFRWNLFKVLFSAILSGLIVYKLTKYLFIWNEILTIGILILTFLIIYVILLFITKSFKQEDFLLLKSIKHILFGSKPINSNSEKVIKF